MKSNISIIDLHADLPADVVRLRSLGEKQVVERRHYSKLREGSVQALIAPIWVESSYKPDRALKRAVQIVEAFLEDVGESQNFAMARSYEELLDAGRRNRIGVILGAEGGEFIEDDVAILHVFHRLGLRCFGFVWNQRNLIADGWDHKNDDRGLTDFGKQVVEELDRLRIIIDLAHIAPKSFWDVIELAKRPVIVSHGATSRHEALRNLTDEQMKAIASNGGIVGIFAINYAETNSLEAYLDHIEHAVKVAGVDHVALGPDFYDYLSEQVSQEPGPRLQPMPGLEDHTKLGSVLPELSKRGFSDEEVRMIAHDNFTRLFREVVG